MTEISIEQAIFDGADGESLIPFGQSSGFRPQWHDIALRLCAGFGKRPLGVRCPAALFAQRFDRQTVAVVQVADRQPEGGHQSLGLRFRFLIIPRVPYEQHIANPFAVDARFPLEVSFLGALPELGWPVTPVPQRTVAEIQRILQRAEGPALLGAAQALVDGGRVVFERPGPDRELLHALWNLLPASSRGELWPATFAFDSALGFHALVVPNRDRNLEGYIKETQAEHYPEGSYELRLQTAAEAGDQADLDAIFLRRSARQVWRFGLVLILVAVVLAATSVLLLPRSGPPRRAAHPASTPQGVNPAPKAGQAASDNKPAGHKPPPR